MNSKNLRKIINFFIKKIKISWSARINLYKYALLVV